MKMYKKHITRIEQLLDSVNLGHLKGLFHHDMDGFKQEVNEFIQMNIDNGSEYMVKHKKMLEIRDILDKYKENK